MVELAFNPFGKDLADLIPEDLEVLRDVHEGWYVEYKSDLISAKACAKAISAMSNTHGGWVFFGILEKSSCDEVAQSFPGLTESNADVLQKRLRQGSSEHLSPTPHFSMRAVESPETGQLIVCVQVPRSNKAPIIHSDGRIYKRVGGSSEPKCETDHNSVAHLIARKSRIEGYHEGWFKSDPILSRGESNMAYVRLLVTPDYWGERRLQLDLSADEVLDIFTKTRPLSIKFDSIFTMSDGYVLRSHQKDFAEGLTTTLKIWNDFNFEFLLPVSTLPVKDLPAKFAYTNRESFSQFLSDCDFGDCEVLDLEDIGISLLALFGGYRKLLGVLKKDGELHAKIKINGCWRKIPFLDVSPWQLKWDKLGVPLIQTDQIQIRSGGEEDSYLRLLKDENSEKGTSGYSDALAILHEIAISCGVFSGDLKTFANILIKTFSRSIDRHSTKNSQEF